MLWSDAALIRADPTGAATTGWEAVAGIGSVALGMLFFCSLTLMLASARRGRARRSAAIDHEPTAGRSLFSAKR